MHTMLNLPQVKARFCRASDATIYNDIRAGLLTRSVRVGARAVGWPAAEIDAIIGARIAGMPDDEIRNLVALLHSQRTELMAA